MIYERLPTLLTHSQGIKYEDLAYGSGNGFVTAGANNGHNGTTLVTALNNEDVVVDYAHRSYVPPFSRPLIRLTVSGYTPPQRLVRNWQSSSTNEVTRNHTTWGVPWVAGKGSTPLINIRMTLTVSLRARLRWTSTIFTPGERASH